MLIITEVAFYKEQKASYVGKSSHREVIRGESPSIKRSSESPNHLIESPKSFHRGILISAYRIKRHSRDGRNGVMTAMSCDAGDHPHFCVHRHSCLTFQKL